jgi:hypothetical protein
MVKDTYHQVVSILRRYPVMLSPGRKSVDQQFDESRPERLDSKSLRRVALEKSRQESANFTLPFSVLQAGGEAPFRGAKMVRWT